MNTARDRLVNHLKDTLEFRLPCIEKVRTSSLRVRVGGGEKDRRTGADKRDANTRRVIGTTEQEIQPNTPADPLIIHRTHSENQI